MRALLAATLLAVLPACSSGGCRPAAAAGEGVAAAPTATPPPTLSRTTTADGFGAGTPVSPSASAAVVREHERVAKLLAGAAELDSEGLLERHAVRFRPYPGARGKVTGLDSLQASTLELDLAEEQALERDGFVVTRNHSFPSFLLGYETIYLHDLPVYVSADSILHAVHRSYEAILEALEYGVLAPEVESLLRELRGSLARSEATLPGAVRADLDLYTAVALSLLTGEVQGPVAGADAKAIDGLVDRAMAAANVEPVELFGVSREVDFSQFRPRGHYTNSERLANYFRASMWLGRTEFRILETQSDGTQRFHRRQLEAALAIRDLFEGTGRRRLARIDRLLQALVGERDDLDVSDLDGLLAAVGARDGTTIASVPDARLAEAASRSSRGLGRISNQIVRTDGRGPTQPPHTSFLLLGQRWTIDSEVMSSLVYDRAGRGPSPRWLPDPLDVAFAALGNDQAAGLLEEELQRHRYAPELERARRLVDHQPTSTWSGSLYGAWLAALRELSPPNNDGDSRGLPAVARSEAWGRRLLSTQLASWAELRHDTTLYAKQSYAAGGLCEYPDAYVDPYPEFFAALRRWASIGRAALEGLEPEGDRGGVDSFREYFDLLGSHLAVLEEMASLERQGKPFRPEHLAFINRAVVVRRDQRMCGAGPWSEGWFAELYFQRRDALEFAPTIADVHTQPLDEGGRQVGRVLHVGTGAPRLLVVLIETSSGPHAYVGLASAYHERTTERFERLTDEDWARTYWTDPPAEPRWLAEVVVGTITAARIPPALQPARPRFGSGP